MVKIPRFPRQAKDFGEIRTLTLGGKEYRARIVRSDDRKRNPVKIFEVANTPFRVLYTFQDQEGFFFLLGKEMEAFKGFPTQGPDLGSYEKIVPRCNPRGQQVKTEIVRDDVYGEPTKSEVKILKAWPDGPFLLEHECEF